MMGNQTLVPNGSTLVNLGLPDAGGKQGLAGHPNVEHLVQNAATTVGTQLMNPTEEQQR
jgi:hypothetical protein